MLLTLVISGPLTSQRVEKAAPMAVNRWAGNAALAPFEPRLTTWRRGWASSERLWALAFATPYACVFLAFVIYPIWYGLWLGSDPATYRELFADPVYPSAVVNTLLYLLIAACLLRASDRHDAERHDLDPCRADGEARPVLQTDHHARHPTRQ